LSGENQACGRLGDGASPGDRPRAEAGEVAAAGAASGAAAKQGSEGGRSIVIAPGSGTFPASRKGWKWGALRVSVPR